MAALMDEANLPFQSHVHQVVSNVKGAVHSLKLTPMDSFPFNRANSDGSDILEEQQVHRKKRDVKLHFEKLNLNPPHLAIHPVFSRLQSKFFKLGAKVSSKIKSTSSKFSQHLTKLPNPFKLKSTPPSNSIQNSAAPPAIDYDQGETADSTETASSSYSLAFEFLGSSNSNPSLALSPKSPHSAASLRVGSSPTPFSSSDNENGEGEMNSLQLYRPNIITLTPVSLQHLSRSERAERIRQQRRRDAWEGIRVDYNDEEEGTSGSAVQQSHSEEHAPHSSTALVPRLPSYPPQRSHGYSPITSMLFSLKYDNRSREMETSVSARGNSWRIDSAVNDIGGRRMSLRGLLGGLRMGRTEMGRTLSERTDSPDPPRIFFQLGPVIFNQESVLVPIGASESHVVWHCYNRRNRNHSTCFSMWSKNKQYKAVGMIIAKPFSIPFLDLQFPNGEFNYVAGTGCKGNLFFRLLNGVVQLHSNHSKDIILSYDYKSNNQTHFRPQFFFQKQCFAFSVSHPFGWRKNGFKIYPAFEFNVTPTMGGIHSGIEGQLKYFPSEDVSVDLGYKKSTRRGQEIAFTSLSIGEVSKTSINGNRNNLGVSVRLRLEAPLADPRRFGLTLELNKSCEF